jgi:RNA polymerase sigma-70 factor (ECF subfamily)
MGYLYQVENIMDITNPAKTVSCWVELYTSKLLSWAHYKVSDKDLAKDLVQETFLVAVQSFHQFKANSEPKTWLLAILNHKIIDHYRKLVRSSEIPLSNNDDLYFTEEDHWKKEAAPKEWATNDPNLLDDESFNNVLKLCMGRLPKTWLAAVQLKYLEDKDGKIICQELGITQSNFWQMLHRAKLQLRACLENHWFKK